MPFSQKNISGSRTASVQIEFRRAFAPEKTPSPPRLKRTPHYKNRIVHIPADMFGRRDRSGTGRRCDRHSLMKKASRPLLSKAVRCGSVTVEAAFVLPLALFFVLTFFSFFSILRIQIEVQKIMERTMEQVSVLAASGAAETVMGAVSGSGVGTQSQPDASGRAGTALNLGMLEAGVRLGMADMEDVSGVTLLGTDLDAENGTAKLVVTYGVQIRTAFFHLPTVRLTQVSYRRLWTGTAAAGADGRDGQIVYVTEYGRVYHLSRNCRHLIQRTEIMTWEQMQAARSLDGAIYYACHACHPTRADGRFFVAAYGNRYHSTLSCPQLRITVRAVTLDEVGDLPCCATCAAGG